MTARRLPDAWTPDQQHQPWMVGGQSPCCDACATLQPWYRVLTLLAIPSLALVLVLSCCVCKCSALACGGGEFVCDVRCNDVNKECLPRRSTLTCSAQARASRAPVGPGQTIGPQQQLDARCDCAALGFRPKLELVPASRVGVSKILSTSSSNAWSTATFPLALVSTSSAPCFRAKFMPSFLLTWRSCSCRSTEARAVY